MSLLNRWKKAGQIQQAGYSRGIILLVILSPSENKNLFVEKKEPVFTQREDKGKIRKKTTICSVLLSPPDRWIIMTAG